MQTDVRPNVLRTNVFYTGYDPLDHNAWNTFLCICVMFQVFIETVAINMVDKVLQISIVCLFTVQFYW